MKKNGKTPIVLPDDALFSQALEGVTPLAPSNRAATTQPAGKSSHPIRTTLPAPARFPDTLSDQGAEDSQVNEFLRPGMTRMTLRKLRRGHWPVQDRLDLHGLTRDQARKLVQDFLREAVSGGQRCVLVIHGKGRRSAGGEGILKTHVRHWLSQCAEVLAFCEAPPREGGMEPSRCC